MNYEISKTRKYKKDIGKMENMEYDPEKTVIVVKTGNANSPISEKTKDSNWISPDGDCLSMP